MITVTHAKIIWVLLLVLCFLSFSIWYGGSRKPISPEEGRQLLERLTAVYGEDSDPDRGFIANMAEMIPHDDGREFYAVNLEDLKDGSEAAQSDRAYAGIVVPLLLKRASHPVIVSERAGLMLGRYGSGVDRVVVVRYRSLRDMIEMTLEPSMQDGEVYKFAALNHTEVFITRPYISFVQVRFVVALILVLIAWIGLGGLDAIAARLHQPKQDAA